MVLFNHSTRELTAKIVYYGAGLCGKTTNLMQLHERLEKGTAGRLLSLATAQDRTIYFDLLPVELGNIKGYTVRFQLCTVPGQVYYNETRKLVLRGVDGIVFVVDSQWSMLSHNLESFQNLRENLADADVAFDSIPLVVQYNKRDLPGVLSVDALQESLGFQSYPYVEAIAAGGKGVVETFKLVSKLTFVDLLRRLQKIPSTEEQPRGEVGEETVVQGQRKKPSSFVETVSVSAPPIPASAATAPPVPVAVTVPPATPVPVGAAASARPSPDDSWRRLFAKVGAPFPKKKSGPSVPVVPAVPASPPSPPPAAHTRPATNVDPFDLGGGDWKPPGAEGEVFGEPVNPAAEAKVPTGPVTEPTFGREDVFDPSTTIAISPVLPPPATEPAVSSVAGPAAPAHASAPAAADAVLTPAPAAPTEELLALRGQMTAELERLGGELAALRSAITSDVTAARDGAEAAVAALREEVSGTLDAALNTRVMSEIEALHAAVAEMRQAHARSRDEGDGREQRTAAELAAMREAVERAGGAELERIRSLVGEREAAIRMDAEAARRQLLEAHGELAARLVPRDEIEAVRRDSERLVAVMREELDSTRAEREREIAELRGAVDALRGDSDRPMSALRDELAEAVGELRRELASAREEQRSETRRLEAAIASAREEMQALRTDLETRSKSLGDVVEATRGSLAEELGGTREALRRELERLDAAVAEARRRTDEHAGRLAGSLRRVLDEIAPSG